MTGIDEAAEDLVEIFRETYQRVWTPSRAAKAIAVMLKMDSSIPNSLDRSVVKRQGWLRHLQEALARPVWVQVCGKATLRWQEDDARPPDAETRSAALLRILGTRENTSRLLDSYDGGDAFYYLYSRQPPGAEMSPSTPMVRELRRVSSSMALAFFVLVSSPHGDEIHVLPGEVVDLHLAIVQVEAMVLDEPSEPKVKE
jgi:hypothetical protein